MSEKRTVSIGVIGLGSRTETLLFSILQMKDVRIAAICDLKQERIDKISSILSRNNVPQPAVYRDCKELIKDPQVEAVFIPTSWNSHLKIACDTMKEGKYAAIEVGGASSIEELWQLIRASEESGAPCMMLENCCYGRNELLILNLVRKGLFGELIYCECGYEHYLGKELAEEYESGLERCRHNLHRNGDLYLTHGLGPIAKILRINRGNRFLSVSSHATKSRGFSQAVEKFAGASKVHFNEGDIVTTVIHCANGENITITHGVSLPRPYTRNGRVQGTRGIWLENANGIYIDGISPCLRKKDPSGSISETHEWEQVESYYEKYDHPLWKEYKDKVAEGRRGYDIITLEAFIDAVRNRTQPPIDVYDCAAWMSITCLSEQSVALGGMPVPCPDFTNGRWIESRPASPSKWSLDEVFD
ncbi:MAG: Gfo/Idh/MocA family oxidoreductase [Lentisphaeria bacterium]|nr:Gfo/Idh/MocA family oxidoreductase [Lentisphaeria bacterium]